ncbi:MAG: hypothetical protein IPP94_18125 [Ignavibacteria bacterium]|nr:hypothetical protein [Ignavibacteria bacterium]
MKQLTEFRLRRIISPMARVWVTVVVVVSLSGSIYVVEVRQNALIMHFRTMEAMLHQSQLDLAKGYGRLHGEGRRKPHSIVRRVSRSGSSRVL